MEQGSQPLAWGPVLGHGSFNTQQHRVNINFYLEVCVLVLFWKNQIFHTCLSRKTDFSKKDWNTNDLIDETRKRDASKVKKEFQES